MVRAALLLAALLAAPSASAAGLEALSWLAGSWVAEKDGLRSEEHYMAPAGGVMPGMHRTSRPGKTPSVEFIRIVEEGGTLVYMAAPVGQSPAAFPLTEAAPGLAVFENPAHDFPTRIEYRRDGDRLTATVSGPGKDGKTVSQSWTWQRAAGVVP
ncbi:MAG TPA: DUF6265 family protein [Azospirillaceae bacterium]|nr:DUF6265 family protein [Azospirillaceae bacterium]